MTATTQRRSTGKRLRFEVFKRDYFTCQYCGAQPPGVVLVVDHVTPVAGGGTSTQENLITACEPCNQGKGDRPLTERVIRPDADLMLLEAQQEIAELLRYQRVVEEREVALGSAIETLQDQWRLNTGIRWDPGERIFRNLLNQYSIDVVAEATAVACRMVRAGRLDTYDDKWVAYFHGIARNLAKQQDGRAE